MQIKTRLLIFCMHIHRCASVIINIMQEYIGPSGSGLNLTVLAAAAAAVTTESVPLLSSVLR